MVKKLKNQFEKKIYSQLKRNKIKFSYEALQIPYILARHYIPDFVIETPTGNIYVECKGYFRTEDKAKLAAVKRQHPEIDLRIIFYKYNDKNIKWANKIGIKWSLEKIPKDWLKGF